MAADPVHALQALVDQLDPFGAELAPRAPRLVRA
jgi:hypothetical protein